MTAAIDRMAHVGEMPWHRDSTYLGEGEVTAEEMRVGAGMTWTVSKAQTMYQKPDGALIRVPNDYVIIRDDTGQKLGKCTGRWNPLQPAKAFNFFDEVIGEGLAAYHTAGSLGNGERIWILVKLPEDYDLRIAGVDHIESYILMVNGYDANTSFQMLNTKIRVVCQNTLNIATDYGRNMSGYRISHIGDIEGRLNATDARKAIGLVAQENARFEEVAQRMAQTPISDEELAALCQRLFPTRILRQALPAPSEDELLLLPEPDMNQYQALHPESFQPHIFQKREIVTQLANEGMGNDNGQISGTRWTAFQGVAEYTDYVKGWDSKRNQSLLFGSGRDLKQQAWDLLRK